MAKIRDYAQFPISGLYVSAEDVSRMLYGRPDQIVLSIPIATPTGRGLLREDRSISRKQFLRGVAGVVADRELTAELIKDAYKVSDSIDSGVREAPGPNPFTDQIVAKFEFGHQREAKLWAVTLVHIVVSIVLHRYFSGEEKWPLQS